MRMSSHHKWPLCPVPELPKPLCPVPEHEGVDEKALFEMEVLLQEGIWPDGFSPEERENLARVAPKSRSQAPEACQDSALNDKWQARSLTTLLQKALRESCQLGYSDHNSL